jgi:hypothetical protein
MGPSRCWHIIGSGIRARYISSRRFSAFVFVNRERVVCYGREFDQNYGASAGTTVFIKRRMAMGKEYGIYLDKRMEGMIGVRSLQDLCIDKVATHHLFMGNNPGCDDNISKLPLPTLIVDMIEKRCIYMFYLHHHILIYLLKFELRNQHPSYKKNLPLGSRMVGGKRREIKVIYYRDESQPPKIY